MWAIIIMIVTSVAIALGFVWFPAIGDDIGYMGSFKNYIVNGKPFDPSGITESISIRYQNDNARLANVVMTFLAPLPRAIGAWLSVVALVAVFWIGSKLGSFTTRPWPLILFIAGVVFCCPWIDQLYLIDFQLNYLWASALMLWLLISWLKESSAIGLFFLGLVVGVWHEGFGLPAAAGIFVSTLLFRQNRSLAKTAAALSGLAIGLAYLYFSPAMQNRLPGLNGYFSGRMIMVIPFAIPTVIYIVALVIRKMRHKNPDIVDVLMATVSLSSVAIMLWFEMGSRVGMPAVICSLIGLIKFIPDSPKRLIPAVILGAFTLIHIIAVDIVCLKLKRETEAVIALYRSNPRETIFSPMTSRGDVPLICMLKPYFDWFAHEKPAKFFSDFYGKTKDPIMVVPEAIADYDPEKASRVDGDAQITRWGGHNVGPAIDSIPRVITLVDNYGRGLRQRDYYVVPFTSRYDGKKYAWYNLDHTWLDATLHPEPIQISTIKPED